MSNDSLSLSYVGKAAKGTVTLAGSKSISNRVLIIQALCGDDFDITNLSTSDDTVTLQQLLASDAKVLDAHHAGTTYRFMTAYLAASEGERTLTGSARMLQRPIGPLVDALRSLGASITYESKEGYPPLAIKGSTLAGGKVSIDATMSSQYLSALLLIAPTLEHGLEMTLVGDLVSKPYLLMTLRIMEYFGVEHTWVGDIITVAKQDYIARDFYVEADWSAASYYYSIAALAPAADITLVGLQKDSLQGDAVIADISKHFGIETTYGTDEVRLTKPAGQEPPAMLEYDFLLCPDIAQTVSVMCAGLGVQALFSGLQTLYIKETDRVAALQTELLKVGVYFSKLPEKFSAKSGVTYHMQEGKATAPAEVPTFATYHDHRMAMAFAPLSLLMDICVEDPGVVSKSYGDYWADVAKVLS